MDDNPIATPELQERSGVGRRTVLTAAWSVPAISVLAAAPAMAASNTAFAFTGLTPSVINANNSTASLVVSGTGPDGKTISLSLGTPSGTATVSNGAWSGTATVSNGVWSATIPSASVPEGNNVVVTAAYGGTSLMKTYIKDITAPIPTITGSQYVAPPTKTLKVTGTRGMVGAPTADSSSVTVSLSGGATASATVEAGTDGSWSYTFDNVNPNKTITITVSQSDGAGNIGTASSSVTT